MLTFRQLDDLPEIVVEIYGKTSQTIINGMARRIASLEQITDSTVYQMERLQAMGAMYGDIVRELSKALNLTERQIEQLFDEAATRTLDFDDRIYRAAGLSPLPLSENPQMQQIIRAGLAKTMGEFQNLTSTTAYYAYRQFIQAMDLAHMQIVTGAMDYKTAIKYAIKDLARTGLVSIRYPTGHRDMLDVVVRRAVLTGANQTAGRIQEQRLDEMGCSVAETSAHAGARPDHAMWQGRRFFWSEKGGANPWGYPDFIQSTGYGTGPGLCGWNCRHSWYPVPDPGAPPANAAARLDEMNNREVTHNGKKMSLYDATQRQREIERHIRRWKREASAMDTAGQDVSYITGKNGKLRKWQAAQRDFINQTGLRRDYFRERAGKQNTA